uniref:ent-kaurenoic acid monooxygenase n=2 Tax=Oryza meridionalis TaxID=40149 RepID=A0A0E0DVN7_9ORYZ
MVMEGMGMAAAWAAGDLWVLAAAVVAGVVLVDAVVRRAHDWVRVAALGAERRSRLPPGEMGWPMVGSMWAFLRAFKSGNPDAFIASFIRRLGIVGTALFVQELTAIDANVSLQRISNYARCTTIVDLQSNGYGWAANTWLLLEPRIQAEFHLFGRTGVYRTFMFSSPTILAVTPEACKQVLMDDEGFVTGWPKATVTLIGPKSFVNMSYDDHRRIRKLTAAPINGFDALTTYLSFIDQTVVASLRRWSSPESGQVEFLTELRRMTFKIIVQIFMSGADDATMEALERSYTDLNYGMRAMAINLPGFAYYRALRARRKLVSVLQGVLDGRRAAAAKGFKRSGAMDMMDRLIEAEDERGRRLADDEIVDVLIMYLNAGHESSGHITMWATVFLQENPDIFARAKAEQEEIMRSIPATQNGLTLRDFKKMHFLSQVVDETLRCVNISFVSFRQATRDIYVNGYLIPKGWKVQLWYRSVHMDDQVYPDPKMFNPSRWEGPPPKAGTFLPFGLGARLCPGNDLAKLEISVFLHHFLLGYKLKRANPKCRVRYLPHPRPVDNCLATITKVSDEH